MGKEFDVIESYVAVWNEPDPEERRRRIRSVWSHDGSTCYRLLDARGHEAIEERVRISWDKWLSEGKFVFRPKRATAHHDAIKLDFVMMTVPKGEIEANGLSFLLLNGDGELERDYQFNPLANEQSEVADRYVAMWNEADTAARRRRVTDLWAPDGRLLQETATKKGRAAIVDEVTKVQEGHAARGHKIWSANFTYSHHNLLKIKWRVAADASCLPTVAGTDLLVLDGEGLINVAYRFDEAI